MLPAFTSCLEGLVFINGNHFARPENRSERDKLNNLIGEAQDAWEDDGDTLKDEDNAHELVDELADALDAFAPPYCYFGAHPGDGADFGFWVGDIEQIKDDIAFTSSEENEYPADDFRGEWLHINERGNVTLYVREDAGRIEDHKDTELWSIV